MRVVVRLAIAAAVVATIVVLSSCSSQPSLAQAEPSTGVTDAGSPVRLSSGARHTPLAVATLLTSTQASRLTSMPWILTARDDKTATIELLYVAGDGDCVKPRGLYLRQTTTYVLIEVLSATALNRTACASPLTIARSLLQLAVPLGSRSLIHAKVSREWSSPNFFRGLTS